VNVFQRGCDVVIQKSLREGSGLVVAEALWNGGTCWNTPARAERESNAPFQRVP
jgi:hypothetical protein